ncbi:M28 family peptidase [Siccirubricoccus sp. G192]|uniref:M28 family peptidase n=1 Tax=Siccirubricoccus sp. G192 TaxID=2849651 RepID=UPI001C2BB626|nr:M28 family peptidase [Siccirubricoccus sp. G192]MBV1799520.1 M28 family peptidase [Siccirubricoccus sp. G192]
MSEQIIAAVSAANVRAHVERITTAIPSRLAGSANAKRMAEYSRDALRAAGVSAEVHEMPGLVSFPGKGELQVLAPVELAIEANTLGHSLPTLPEGIAGEVIDVRSGDFKEYEGQDAVGKITLSELSYHPARHEKQRIAGLMGSTGCIMMNWGHDGNTAVPFGSVKPAWGNPTPEGFRTEMPTLPCIGIARTAGLKLREMIGQGPVRVRMRANVENGWRPVQITTGEIKAPGSDDFVVVGGHQDSWPGPQATDNAAGNACILELARVFQQHRDKLRRGLVLGFWTAHETGTMIGSSWYVDRNWDRLRDHAVAYLQIDQPGCIGTTRWGTASNAELKGFHQAVEKRVLGTRPASWRRAVKTGDSSFFGLGVPMLAGQGAFTEEELKRTALATLGWWHHSIENTIDKLDWDEMQLHLRVYAGWLWELCTAPVLPFEFVHVADQFIERLTALAPAGGTIGLPGALARAEAFKAAAQRLEAAAGEWRARYAKGSVTDDGPAEVLNACLKRLSRMLVPLASTAKGTYGHDPYGYTPQGSMIPSLYDVPRLGRLPDGEERWMLEVQLVRDRNRIADVLGDCCGLVEDTLRRLP